MEFIVFMYLFRFKFFSDSFELGHCFMNGRVTRDGSPSTFLETHILCVDDSSFKLADVVACVNSTFELFDGFKL